MSSITYLVLHLYGIYLFRKGKKSYKKDKYEMVKVIEFLKGRKSSVYDN